MEALYRMESLCSEAFFGRCRRPVRFIVLFRSVFRAGTVIPFLDNLESFAGTILFLPNLSFDGTAVTDAR